MTVSIVSHGQGALVSELLIDLARCSGVSEIILTHNLPEPEIACPVSLMPRVRVISNHRPKGFGANHNQAFEHCKTEFFAVLNPDIRLESDPFPPLAGVLDGSSAGMTAPLVVNPAGQLEDSVRSFPTPGSVLKKVFGRGDGRLELTGSIPQPVDWAAGMFLLFRTKSFRDVRGFDEGFFLYYEDVDICVRLWRAGLGILVHPGVSVVHSAQRASHRRPRYFVWHLSSLLRYLLKHGGRLPVRSAVS